MAQAWDYTTDILVVGSGGGGMVAAIMAKDQGKSALLIEKGAVYGGSTAMSGGAMWVPNNHLMKQAGLADSPEEGLDYLKAITGGAVAEGCVGAGTGTITASAGGINALSSCAIDTVGLLNAINPQLAHIGGAGVVQFQQGIIAGG